MFTPNTDKSALLSTTEHNADSDAPKTNKNPTLSLEGVILDLLRKTQKIAPDASENIVAPLVDEFEEYYKNLGIAFTISVESLLSLDLTIDVDKAQQLLERINGLHFIYFKVLPKFSRTINIMSLKGMTSNALAESIDRYCLLPSRETEHANIVMFDEITLKLAFPTIISQCDEYEKVLAALQKNLQAHTPHGTTKYTLEKFDKNLDILTRNTKALALPINVSTGHFHKHVESVFFIIGFLKDCHQVSDAIFLLPKVEQLLLELNNKLQAHQNTFPIKLLSLKIGDLAKSTATVLKQITSTLSEVHPDQTLILSEKIANETVQSLFEEDVSLLPLNEKLKLLFGSVSATKQIIAALSTRLANEIATLPPLDTMTVEKANALLTSCQVPINLTLYVINEVLADRPELLSERYSLIADLHTQASYYFIIANRYFKLSEEFSAKDAQYFAVLRQYYQALDSLAPSYSEYILEKAKAIKNKSLTIQTQKLFQQQIYAAHHNVLTYKLCYAIICTSVHEYDLAKKACQATQEASWDVNGTIDELDEKMDKSILKDYQDLVLQIQKKLEITVNLLKNFNTVTATLSKQGKKIVVYVRKNNTVHSVDINETINRIVKATKDDLPDTNSAKHFNLSKNYSQELKVYPVRMAMIDSIIERFKLDSKIKIANKTRLQQDQLLRIKEHQENINTLYYFVCTVAKEQIDSFPQADTLYRFLGLMVLNILMQAKELEKLLLNHDVPPGQYAALYKLLHGNYQILVKYQGIYIGEVRHNPEERATKLKSFVELQAVYVCIFEQFAESELAQKALEQGMEILKTLNKTCNLSSQELDQYTTLLANAKSFELPNPIRAQNLFKAIFEKSTAIHPFLNALGGMALAQKAVDEEAQKRFEGLRERLNSAKSNPVEIADIILNINKDIGLDNAITLLSEIKEYFEEKREYYFNHKVGALGVFAETLICIIIDIDGCLRKLHEQAKLQVINAQKQEKFLAQKEIERAKREAQIQQDKLRKELRKKELQEKQTKTAQAKLEPSVQAQSLHSRKISKAVQRSKKRDEAPNYVEMKPDIPDFKEPKLTKKKRRLLEKAQKEEQERQERVSRQKQAQAQMKKVSKLKQVIESGQSKTNDLTEIQVIETKRQLENQKKQEASQLHKIDDATDEMTEVTKAVAKLNLFDEKIPSMEERIALLEQFFSKERIQQRQLNLPDEAFKIDNLQIEIKAQEKAVLDLFHAHNVRAFMYGGNPRDALLGREPHDADFVVFCPPERAKAILGEKCVDNQNNPGKQLVFNGADIRCEDESLTLLAFAQERDVTINAMLVDRQGFIYAPIIRSISDLEENELIPIGNTMETFKADPRRIYRFIRQSHELLGCHSASQELAILENAHLLTKLPFKEYRHHFSSLFMRGWALRNIQYISKLQILGRIFPPLQYRDCSDEDLLSWLELECIKMDQVETSIRKHEYSFNRLGAIFLAPVIKLKMCNATLQSLHDCVEQTIDEFYSAFTADAPSDIEKTVMSNIVKVYYAEYINHLHRQANLRKRQAKQMVLEPLSLTFIPQFRKSTIPPMMDTKVGPSKRKPVMCHKLNGGPS